MRSLSELKTWQDAIPRSGVMNMAIDQLLLEEISDTPILRFYNWKSPSVSLGYFESLATTQEIFYGENLDFIRRMTGGGIVDHRHDLTYTLAIPRSHPWATLRGAESYHLIHQSAAKALNVTGTHCILTPVNTGNGSASCFDNPVAYDIITPAGDKLAGAGQRHTRQGLLHQGSVIGITDEQSWRDSFISFLADRVIPWSPKIDFTTRATHIAATRYARPEWLERQP